MALGLSNRAGPPPAFKAPRPIGSSFPLAGAVSSPGAGLIKGPVEFRQDRVDLPKAKGK
jgi:hypothetical protein